MSKHIFQFPDDFFLELLKRAIKKLTADDVQEIIDPPGEQVTDE